MIWTAAAIHSLPVALLDVVIAAFLLHMARTRRSPHTARATVSLGAWFALLTVLNGMHVLSCVAVDATVSFWANHVGESVAVMGSIVPLIAFAYAFAADTDASSGRIEIERRVALVIATVLAGALSVGFVVHSLLLDPSTIFYRVVVEHTETDGLTWFWGQSLSLLVLAGYGHATLVLLRRGARAVGPARGSIFMFAGVVAAAVVAVVVNRLEGDGVLPMGSYATWCLIANLAAIVIFMGHSAELTSFAERIVGIALALVLVSLAGAGEIIVRMRGEREDAVRTALVDRAAALLADAGRDADADAVRVAGALRIERGHDTAPRPRTLEATVIEEPIVTADGEEVRLVFSYLDRARAVDPIARGVALGMVVASLLCVFLLRRLFERSVLVPLRQLERADASSRAKSLFIAQLSHELRTPLSAVVGHARTLVDDLQDPESRTRAARISDAAEVLLSLVEGLIEEGKADLSTIVARHEDVGVRALVEGIVELARPRTKAGVAVVVDVADDVPHTLLTDARLVRQMLLNLLTNAAKHTEAGSITCRVRRVPQGVELCVEDTGRGIPAEEHDKIFQAFHQVAGPDGVPLEGAGLGLAIVQRMADALSTRVRVDSAPGRGSRFSFVLAAAPASAPLLDEPVEVPPGALRAELRELALVGDVLALQERASALAREDPRYAPFSARVERLTRDYQVGALQALLEG